MTGLSPALVAIAICGGLPVLASLTVRTAATIQRQRKLRTLSGLRELAPATFERTVGAWLARAGWVVELRGGSGDGGLDLVAYRGGRVLAVQCKRYGGSSRVTPAQVRELYGAAAALGATHAVLVTTGSVSAGAKQWVASLPDGGPRFETLEGHALAAVAAAGRWAA